MKTVQNFLRASIVAVSLIAASAAVAAPVTFVPPNDLTGNVWSSNSNDGWSGGRGLGFTVNAAQSISSVGLYQNLSNVTLSYGVYEISALSGSFSKNATLRSGSASVSTNGLEFVDFGFATLNLNVGTNYLIEFSFNGNSNQNFFYNNSNTPWTQGAFSSLEGTSGNSFSNFVVGAFRVDAAGNGQVPEPGNVFLMGAALAGLLAARRVRKA